MDSIDGRRMSREAQRARADRADGLLREGTSERRVARELGYVSVHAMRLSVERRRRQTGFRKNAGWVKLSRSQSGSVRIVLSSVPLRRCGWSGGMRITWQIEGERLLVTRAPNLTRAVACYDPDDPDSVAFCLLHIRGLEIGEIAIRFRVSRSEAYRMVLRHAARHAHLDPFVVSADKPHGIARIGSKGASLSLALTTPAKQLGWGSCDVVRWERPPGHARVLCLTLETSASQAAG